MFEIKGDENIFFFIPFSQFKTFKLELYKVNRERKLIFMNKTYAYSIYKTLIK